MHSDLKPYSKLAAKFPDKLMPTIEMQQAIYSVLKSITEDKNALVSYKTIHNNSFFEIKPNKYETIIAYNGQRAEVMIEYINIFKIYENINIYIADNNSVYIQRMSKISKIS